MSIRELRDSLPSIGEILEKESEILVTRHGRAVAKLVAAAPSRSAPSHADLRASIPFQSVPSQKLVREDREGG
jgi:antitoxin (DNA-binding transcriptional repressor) of toxin-antitoxin stability system